MTDPSQITVTLGAHEVPVYPQPWPYLLNSIAKMQKRLAGSMAGLSGASATNLDGVIALVGANLYDVLVTAVPKAGQYVPRHEFAGFASPEAMDVGDFDEQSALKAPTIPQIKTAFKVAAEVNGVDVIEKLTGAAKAIWGQLDPTMRQSLLTVVTSEVLARTDSASTISASSPSTNGGSPTSTPSGEVPTSTESTPD